MFKGFYINCKLSLSLMFNAVIIISSFLNYILRPSDIVLILSE